jgi:hypothetical protein
MASILILTGDSDPSRQNNWSRLTTNRLSDTGHNIRPGTTMANLIIALETSDLVLIGNDDPRTCQTLIPPEYRRKTIVFAANGIHIGDLRILDAAGFTEVSAKPDLLGLLHLINLHLAQRITA